MNQKHTPLIIAIVISALLLSVAGMLLVQRSTSKGDTQDAGKLRTYVNEEDGYSFMYPEDGKRIYKVMPFGKTGITVDAGVADKPGKYIHTVFSVSVLEMGDPRDNAPKTLEDVERQHAEFPQDALEPIAIEKAGAIGVCYYLRQPEIDRGLSCRYEYQGKVYYLSASNYVNEENETYFAGTGGKMLDTSEAMLRSFKFLP